MNIVVMVSGSGSNLKALHAAIVGGHCDANIVKVIADRNCDAIDWLKRSAPLIDCEVIPYNKDDREGWQETLRTRVTSCSPDLVILAGFMRILNARFVNSFRTINVHPSLLPAFPGLHATRQAIEAGVRISGCTVHYVDAGVDTGEIIAQAATYVLEDDDEASLHRRIQSLEHRLLPRVVSTLATSPAQHQPPALFSISVT